ncbi:LacI family DNA-binding transcriptional regulator [Microbacterium hydrocarbonoxydans]|uniref:LacI family DNA-binding transcriptional regulator n=1 Tax=Microbacterium hydrocarbonoxydans TaxID=273678 RepID=UPI0007BC08CE|nr:LacI family DNA-binding transcriptional regulator [Microbacterium hydrocarbonoxydans]GAT74412.1 transcriptional regulator, LacI family [Microbacterium sp. HM58-2]
MPRKKVGIRDVAEHAGVSVTTVSHVLNETPHTRTSEETATRVRAAAEELGYRPNRLARGLRTQTSGMVGLLTEEIATTPYAGRIILGAQERASDDNLTLAIINTQLSARPIVDPAQVQAFLDRQIDGIIYATVFHDVVVAPPTLHTLPAVLIGAKDRDGVIPSVVPDERAGAASVVRMLVQTGHTRIGFTDAAEDVPATRGRLIGYGEAMAEAGLPTDGLVVAGTSDAAGGYEATRALLAMKEPPTAVFCYDDRMAMGAYRAVAERGLRIPEDLSIVGFDDQAPIPTSLFPALTTVALPHYEMGEWAVSTLVDLFNGDDASRRRAAEPVRLTCPLVVRDSVAPPRA